MVAVKHTAVSEIMAASGVHWSTPEAKRLVNVYMDAFFNEVMRRAAIYMAYSARDAEVAHGDDYADGVRMGGSRKLLTQHVALALKGMGRPIV